MGLFLTTTTTMADGKNHISIVICGHVDAGKSTTTGRLLFELGDLDPRLLEKLTAIAKENGKESFKYAYVMDTQKDERERGVTISCQTKEFFTEKFHYTIVDAPGHRDYVGNMIRGSSQVDIALLMVPADGFITALSDGKDGGVKGQTREHAMLLNLLGVKQLIIGVNKMDSDSGTGPCPDFGCHQEERPHRLRPCRAGRHQARGQGHVPAHAHGLQPVLWPHFLH